VKWRIKQKDIIWLNFSLIIKLSWNAWYYHCIKILNVWFTFVAIRLVSSFLVLLIWIYVIWDKLTTLNFLWFFIWAYAIFLLSWFSKNDLGKLNSRWLFGVIISIVWITFSHTYYKFIADGTNFHDLMLIQSTVSFLCFWIYAIIRRKYKDFNTREFKLCLFPAFIVANLTLLYFLYFLPNMYLLWPLSLSYKMLSYSLIVPIILSVIFLWEKLNKKKIFALVLTVISIALFI